MPIINTKYKAARFLRNGHFQTIYPALFRQLQDVEYQRERIYTADHDFLDLDWIRRDSTKLVILCHGLEGNSQGIYNKAMVRALQSQANCDVLAMNYRGCSGEPNKLVKFYHSGKTEDLELVIKYALETDRYRDIFLIGFSIGGNIVMKFLGEQGSMINSAIKQAVAFSVPVDLACCARELSKFSNQIYMKKFLIELKKKIQDKEKIFPNDISSKDFTQLKNFYDFDSRYTAPYNGFSGAEDYWSKASSKYFLDNIQIPTLLVQAEDDPFLGKDCYPISSAENNSQLHLEISKHGGHVGFMTLQANKQYYSESRAIDFLNLSD